MLNNQESLSNQNPPDLSQKYKDRIETPKQSILTSAQTESQNLKQKGEKINDTTLQQATEYHKSKDIAAGLIWHEDQDQESQKEEALDLSGAEQDQPSENEQFAQDQYPSDYDADQDTYFQKSVNQVHSSEKNNQDSEWPQPLVQVSPKQSQDEEAPISLQLQKIEIQRFMTSQEFMDFINKNYLKKINENSDDSEKSNSKLNQSNNSQHKKIMFKDTVSIKRYKQYEQVYLITLAPQEIQNLNISGQPKSPAVQHKARQILSSNNASKDKRRYCEYSTNSGQRKCIDKIENTKELKTEQSAQKVKCTQNTEVGIYQQKQNLKQNYEKQEFDYHPKKQTQIDEDKCIEIWSSLEDRAIKLK